MLNKITQGDSIEEMRKLADKSIDMILCDLPYGTTACKWDTVIPFEPLWAEYERVIKDNGAIVLTASQPFTSALVMSNPKLFKYSIVWEKSSVSNPFMAKRQILKVHEDVCIFYKKQTTYNPQMVKREEKNKRNNNQTLVHTQRGVFGESKMTSGDSSKDYGLPKSVIKFNRQTGLHPTQKPVKLFEYLIRTFSNEGDVILDNCIGSGTTAVAAINTGRQFIGIERETEYCEIARQRIADALQTEVDGN